MLMIAVLIALYGQAYSDITENAVDEYLALFAHKTLQFVRAPDQNVFLPPFNLVEIFGLILPFEWWLSKARYAKLNDKVRKKSEPGFVQKAAFNGRPCLGNGDYLFALSARDRVFGESGGAPRFCQQSQGRSR